MNMIVADMSEYGIFQPGIFHVSIIKIKNTLQLFVGHGKVCAQLGD